jgi:ABC-2 type transport system permease protein
VGKVIGIGAVGLLQVVVFGGAALVTALATDVVTIGSTAIAVFAASVVWYVLGFAFFAVLYAALGSLVSRQEDVNNATMPLSILAFAMFFAAQASLSTPDAGWIEILSWVPPFSATLMPLRIAGGVTGPLQVVGTVVIMIVATALAAVFAARIYESSVLNTGGRQSLRTALARSR